MAFGAMSESIECGYKDASGAIADQHNKKPVPVGSKD
jgi:hypothetical protein